MRLIQTVADELEIRAKNAMNNMDFDSDGESESVAGSDEKENNRLENDFGGALSSIRNCGFVDAGKVAQRILGSAQVTAAEWLFARMELTGICDKNMRYVMIDEVQDYTIYSLWYFGSSSQMPGLCFLGMNSRQYARAL